MSTGQSIPSSPKPTAASFPKSVELDTRIELASYSFGQKDFDQTREHADRVLEEVPGDPRALALLAACQILVGDVNAGITGLNQAVVGTAIDRYEQEVEQAYQYMAFSNDETVEIDWQGFNDCIQFLSQPEFASDDDAGAWLITLQRARACAALERNDAKRAITDLKQHLREYPQDTEARFELGRAYFQQQQWPVATELFRQVLDDKANHEFALSLLGRIAAIESDFQTAVEYASQAYELSPQNCRMRLDLAEYYCANGDYRDSLQVLEDAERCVCAWFELLHCRLECYRELEDFESASEVCQQMLACDPTDVVPEFDLELGHRIATAHRVLCVAELECEDKSLLLLEQVADSLVAERLFALDTAALFRSYGKWELARRLVECLSYLHPLDYDVQLALSVAEREVGDIRREKQILRQLIADLPTCGAAYLHLAVAHERECQFKESLFWGTQAACCGDPDGLVAYQLAKTYAQIGAAKQSLEQLQIANSINRSYRGKAETDETFEKLAGSPEFKSLLRVNV